MYQHIHTQHLHGWQLVLVVPVHHGDGVQVQLLLLQVTLNMGGHFYDGRGHSQMTLQHWTTNGNLKS